MTIVKFEKDLGFGKDTSQNILVYEFVQAFPKSISSVPVSYDGSNVLKTTVSFTYTRYFISSLTTKVDSRFTKKQGPNPNAPGNVDLNGDIASVAESAIAQSSDITNRRSSQWLGSNFKTRRRGLA